MTYFHWPGNLMIPQKNTLFRATPAHLQLSAHETDLLNPLRNGEPILPLIQANILAKAKELGGQFTPDFENIHTEDIHNRSMITIGG